MPTKETAAGRKYDIDGKRFTWHPLNDDGETGALPDVTIPLRIKLKVVRSIADREMNAAAMFSILEALIPGQADTLDEMDINDFQAMFSTWQTEYNLLGQATPGESAGSPT